MTPKSKTARKTSSRRAKKPTRAEIQARLKKQETERIARLPEDGPITVPVKPISLGQRILSVMRDVTYLQKDGVVRIAAKGGGSFEYSAITHDAVTAAVRQACVDNGIIVEVSVREHQYVENKGMAILTVDLYLLNADDFKDFIKHTTVGYGQDYGDKGPGKALSYAVKYAYLKAFMLETGEDEESRVAMPETGPITAEEVVILQDLMDETDTTEVRILNYLRQSKSLDLSAIEQIPANFFPLVRAKLSGRKKQLADPEGE